MPHRWYVRGTLDQGFVHVKIMTYEELTIISLIILVHSALAS